MGFQRKRQLTIGQARKRIEAPTWDQVHQALLAMDGDLVDQVDLSIEGIGGLLAGGGNEGRYIVIYFPEPEDEDYSLTLTDLSETGPDVWLKTQTFAWQPAKVCVRLPLVLKVFEHFFHTGELLKDVRWEFDSSGIEADLSSPRYKSLREQEEEKEHEARRFFESQGFTFVGYDCALVFEDKQGNRIRVTVTIGPGEEVEYLTERAGSERPEDAALPRKVGTKGRTVAVLAADGEVYVGMSGRKHIEFRVNATSTDHAEIDALNQLYLARQRSGVTGGHASLAVDQVPCRACWEQGGLRSAVRAVGLESLTVTYPGGIMMVTPYSIRPPGLPGGR